MNPNTSISPAPSTAAGAPAAAHALVHRLGQAGLVPFVGLGLLLWLVNDQALPYVALGTVAYAALVASFLGGIHWGVVWVRLSTPEGAAAMPGQVARRHLLWGIAPSVLAWPGVLMPAYAALPWLGLVLVACYLADRKLYPAAGLGAWLTLRFRLSAAAALCCFLGAGAV
jgi:hypothetical protein